MNKEYVAGLLKDVVGEGYLKTDVLMRHHTSFKVGGPADILVMPRDDEALRNIIAICRNENVPVFIMGNGTNLIVRDKGIRGVVVKLLDNYSRFIVQNDIIEADAGILLSKVSSIALEHELSGMEFASGIPGTLGGAVYMNAGAYSGEMKDIVIYTEYMDKYGNKWGLQEEEHKFGYRTSIVQKTGGIVLRTKVKLKKGNKNEIKSYMTDLNARRKDKQPLEMPCAGSIFKRPEGYYAGKLIEDCGLKGYSIGGAGVSNKHCGFIVNLGNATADDIVSLIQYVQTKVKGKFGVELQTEVKIIGE